MRALAFLALCLLSAPVLAQDVLPIKRVNPTQALPAVSPAGKAPASPAPAVPVPAVAPAPVAAPPPASPRSNTGQVRAELTPRERRVIEGLGRNAAPHRASSSGVQPPPPDITVRRGHGAMFAIALNHLNRLVTPFDEPVVKTTSTALISQEANIIYVSASTRDPVSFFIHAKDDPEHAISVTMVPRDVPPVSVKLHLEGYQGEVSKLRAQPGNADLARGWETNQPFVEGLKATFRDIALGKVPDGYALNAVSGPTPLMPFCQIPGLNLSPKQVLTGYNMQVLVVRVDNHSAMSQIVEERACANSPRVLAVAAWPDRVLPPGGVDELYIALRSTTEPDSDVRRPSLIPGGVR